MSFFVLVERDSQSLEIFFSRNLDGAEVHEVRVRHLRVEQHDTAVPTAPRSDETDRRLRRIGTTVKHRLAAEESAEHDAVQAADQQPAIRSWLARSLHLDRVRDAEIVQRRSRRRR